jgi:tetratricopeptide (TPR) repeat protein
MRLVMVMLLAALSAAGCARSPEAKKARHLERGDRFFAREQYRDAVIEYRNVRRLDANNGHAIRQLGLAHFQLGEMGQAFDYLRKARDFGPGDADVRVKLGTIYLLARHAPEAQAEAAGVLEHDDRNFEALLLSASAADTPAGIAAATARLESVRGQYGDRARLHVGLGTLYLRTGDLARTEAAFKEAAAREPKSVEAHTALGDLYMARRDVARAEQSYVAAAANAPAGSRPRLKLADFYLTQQRTADAKRVLAEMTESAPDYLPAWRRLAEIAFNEGRHDDGLKHLEVVFKKSAMDVEGHLLSGRVHLAKRDTGKAAEEFQKALKIEPRLAQARYMLALTHLQAGNVQQGRAELKELVALEPDLAEAAVLLAELDVQAGALQPAIEALQKMTARRPEEVRAWITLGSAHLAKREPARAAEAFSRVMALAPKDPRGPYFLGLALSRMGKKADAQRAFEAALAVAPDAVEPLMQLVGMAFADKAPDAALARVQAQLARVPASAALHRVLGSVHVRRQEPSQAEAAFVKSLQLDPAAVAPYLALAELYNASGQYEQALERVGRALGMDGKSLMGHMLAGLIHERKGDVAKARQAYERALAVKPRFAPAANNLAYLHSLHGGDKEKALELAQLAKEVAPDEPHISDTLGWILYRRGIYQRALALLKDSAAKLPDNAVVQYHLGMAHYKAGSRDSARDALTRALHLNPQFPGIEEARSTLASL